MVLTSNGEKIDFLKDPAAYPDHPPEVVVKETHHSWVFLTTCYAYKLKKPIKDRYHDFTTVQKRYDNCREELRLNRRLAQEVYLGIVPLVKDQHGRLSLTGKGRIIDWLVKMIRLPDADMLDTSIREKTVTEEEIEMAASKLAVFYKGAPAADINFQQFHHRLTSEILYNRETLLNPDFKLDQQQVEKLHSKLLDILNAAEGIFRDRISQKKLVEGHGDLRPEHVCIRPIPIFIDCLEFCKTLRILDPIDDLAYLALECVRLGRPEIGERFYQKYMEICRDEVPMVLKGFYFSFRALIKARLAIAHYLELQYSSDPHWYQKAQFYLLQAKRML